MERKLSLDFRVPPRAQARSQEERKPMALKFVRPPEKPLINALIYGPPKTGKSAGAGTAPGKLLYLNFDLPNATRFVHRRSNQDGRIMEVEIPAWEDGKEHVMDVMKEVTHIVNKPDPEVQSVVVDPVGEMYRMMLEERSRRAIRPSLPAYGDVSVHIERFCRMLCKAPVNTIIVAWEYVQKNDATGEMEKIPFTGTQAGSAVLGQKLQGMVDIVCYSGVRVNDEGTKEYLARLFPVAGSVGGDRFDCLGDYQTIDIARWSRMIEESERAAPETVSTLTQSEGKANPSKRKAA